MVKVPESLLQQCAVKEEELRREATPATAVPQRPGLSAKLPGALSQGLHQAKGC